MTTSPPRARRDPADNEGWREERARPAAAVVAVRKIFASETGNYFLLLGATLFLVIFGLVMVLSSSSVESYKANDDFFTGFIRQGIFAMLGIPLMLLASRVPVAFWKRWAGTAMIIAIALQFLVVATPLGVSRGGNKNWISIGWFNAQPSEVAKVALVLWLALILSKKQHALSDWREIAMPLLPVAGTALLLVLIGGDLGTTIILGAIVAGTAFFAGVRLRILLIPMLVAAMGVLVFAFGTNSRQDRIHAFLTGCASSDNYSTTCWQTVHGWWALASGGIFGVGLGNSKAKWSWLPEADNDFIFAIIGEELGLLGAIVVLLLFIVIAISFVRIMRANSDPFVKIAISAVMVWVIGQAFVNIAVVLGILPVLGVPLPLISAGGSALVTTLFAIGIVLSFARHPADSIDKRR